MRALEVTARHSATAKEALALYNHFRVTRTLPATQEDSFKANLATWEDRATQNLVRLGDKWVAAAEAAKAHEEAAQLFSQAYEMTRLLNSRKHAKRSKRPAASTPTQSPPTSRSVFSTRSRDPASAVRKRLPNISKSFCVEFRVMCRR